MIPSKKYPGKVMIAGEYGVLNGGEALAIPYAVYNTWWSDEHSPLGEKIPLAIMRQLEQHCSSDPVINRHMDVAGLLNSINSKEELRTDIPIGYGLGSSGSVVAAVFDRFKKQKDIPLEEIQSVLGSMESVFHGKSSGLDPLVSYTQTGIHLTEGKSNQVAVKKTLPFILHNTGISRSTVHLVETYRQRLKDQDFQQVIVNKYLPLNKDLIAAWMANDKSESFRLLRKVSALQLEYFNFAIPTHMHYEWEQLLLGEKSVLKLCGAGGGGFMLHFNQPE
jgi:mevalonate kinase